MLLFPSSIFMILLGSLIIKHPPKKINYFYGFRTKKSIKSQHNWDKGQIICGKYIKHFFSYSLYFSIIPIALDIFFLIIKRESILLWSIIIQSIILCTLLLYVITKTNKNLD
ncbi:SdpI family protein [Staphylococcus hominis]|uniref:SdpI family protein n=4 Tax=Staphylococcus TaxID=1279 RepID=UPI0016138355|nr:SdpI family protein [Staphylococcus hominis]MDS3867172.1 SdpI family protein [Staphylococcus hominis]